MKLKNSLFFLFVLLAGSLMEARLAAAGYKKGELTALANRVQTDKGTEFGPGRHNFTEIYEYFFFPIRKSARHIMEIGIAGGAGMRMFREYFPRAEVYGIDIDTHTLLSGKRFHSMIADQANRDDLRRVIAAFPVEFDLILDDGGHTMEQQQVSFGFLFPRIKPGGFYIIEDVHTSIPELYPGKFGVYPDESNTTLNMINKFIRSGGIESQYLTAEEKMFLMETIDYAVLFSRHQGKSISCVIKRREVTASK